MSEDIPPLTHGLRKVEGQTVRTALPEDWPETEKLAGELVAAPNVPERVFETLDFVIDKFLRLPVNRDDFDAAGTDPADAHAARRAWEHTLSAEQKLQLDKNALGGGHLSGVLPIFDMFLTMIQIPEQKAMYTGGNGVLQVELFRVLAKESAELQARYKQEYRNMLPDEKQTFMKEARAFVRGAITRVIEAYQAPTQAQEGAP